MTDTNTKNDKILHVEVDIGGAHTYEGYVYRSDQVAVNRYLMVSAGIPVDRVLRTGKEFIAPFLPMYEVKPELEWDEKTRDEKIDTMVAASRIVSIAYLPKRGKR